MRRIWPRSNASWQSAATGLLAGGLLCWQVGLCRAAPPKGDTPVTPDASPQARALLAWLWDIYGTRIISGQQSEAGREGHAPRELAHIEETTGKVPAIWGLDLSPYTPPSAQAERIADYKVTQSAIGWYAESNGIVSLCWHWHAPIGNGAIYSKDTAFNLRRALEEGTPEHEAVLRDLDAIATQLKLLRDAHVPVLWRPLHEANGRWFWWGGDGDPEPFKNMWRLMFHRFVNDYKLNNLLWVFSPGSSTDLTEWYPGDEYVDIIGMDYYPMDGSHSAVKDIFDQLTALGHGAKLVGLSENGPIPDPELMVNEKADWGFFITWSGGSLTRRNPDEYLEKVYHHPFVMNLGDLPDLKKYPFEQVGRAVKLGFLSPPQDLAVGRRGRQSVTVAIQDAQGRTVRTGRFVVTLALAPDGRTVDPGGHLTVPAINGVATFADLRIGKAGEHYLTASSTGLTSVSSRPFSVGPGTGILREWWTDASFRKITDLTNRALCVTAPGGSQVLDSALEVPYNPRTNFAERIYGLLSPPRIGPYKFQIVCDGVSELWLSLDKSPDKKLKIAQITADTPYSKWPHSHEEWSGPIPLEAGKHYYIEVRHLQRAGAGQLCVGWRLPDGLLQPAIPTANLLLPDAKLIGANMTKGHETYTNGLRQ